MRVVFIAAALLAASSTSAAEIRPDQTAFRDLYEELVETNTTASSGSCTLAAERMATRLKAAGFPASDLRLFAPDGQPKDGGLVATFPGTGKGAMLMLAHIDVVEANRADWSRDPFTLIEEDGYFYGRGVSDDKAHAAIFTDTLIRLKKSGFKPQRTLKLALTCGEEGGHKTVGAEWLVKQHPDWIAADFAINEGGSGTRDAAGKPLALSFQAGEKVFQNFTLETTNPGGHSSRPRPDNAIYSLAAALTRVGQYRFPVQFSDTTRAYFTQRARIDGGEAGAAMTRLLANPQDTAAEAIVARDPALNSTLRTTCVATMVNAGHAENALPQRATAIVNCRMFPGDPIANVQAQLTRAVADPTVKVSPSGDISPTPPPPPLSPLVYGNARKFAEKHFPGIPMIPTMTTGATDGRFLNAAGIPTYGMPGAFRSANGDGTHGLNERNNVAGLYAERDYLFDLIQILSNAKDAK
ncbi:peptidase M20 [Polymorphobacter glacialis]|uniref:Peptidase M20 n=1 Tax=Sandarakinorhabdus glacialis TaxID=1614636 RepID=A0A917E6G8_9SPHN|nr:M20/M25/M40 family metallo-hydrolase [Polymorphobacter glacialis]GGE09123.1 peptidase M20 [Polymorphobacter glacialis]